MEAEAELQEEPQEESQEESQKEEPQNEASLSEPKKRGRPRMTPEQKKEAKAARNRLKVVETKPQKAESSQKAPKTKIIERVVREYVEVPVPAVQQSPFESIGNVLRSRALSEYERKKQQWASFQLI